MFLFQSPQHFSTDRKNGVEWGEKIGAVSRELLRHSPFAVLLVGVR